MKKLIASQLLLTLTILGLFVLNAKPMALAADARPTLAASPAAGADAAVATPPHAAPAEATQATPAAADLALRPCRLDAFRAACDEELRELAAYGLDVDDLPQWPGLGLRRVREAVEQTADAFGGAGVRAERIARFTAALGTDGLRLRVHWDAAPQQRDGNPVRGAYGGNRLYFNPNTLLLDTDTPEEALARPADAHRWFVVHELAHVWDERSSAVAQGRHSARMQGWLAGQLAAGQMIVSPSSYAIWGGDLEAFAESFAATVTGDAASRGYYGSPQDTFIRAALCETGACRP